MLAIIFTVITAETSIKISTDSNSIKNKITTILSNQFEPRQKLRKIQFNNIINLLNTIVNTKNLQIQIDTMEEKINIKDALYQFHTDLILSKVLNNMFALYILNTPTTYSIHQIP